MTFKWNEGIDTSTASRVSAFHPEMIRSEKWKCLVSLILNLLFCLYEWPTVLELPSLSNKVCSEVLEIPLTVLNTSMIPDLFLLSSRVQKRLDDHYNSVTVDDWTFSWNDVEFFAYNEKTTLESKTPSEDEQCLTRISGILLLMVLPTIPSSWLAFLLAWRHWDDAFRCAVTQTPRSFSNSVLSKLV